MQGMPAWAREENNSSSARGAFQLGLECCPYRVHVAFPGTVPCPPSCLEFSPCLPKSPDTSSSRKSSGGLSWSFLHTAVVPVGPQHSWPMYMTPTLRCFRTLSSSPLFMPVITGAFYTSCRGPLWTAPTLHCPRHSAPGPEDHFSLSCDTC